MKKYVKPEMAVIKMECKDSILATSNVDIKDEPGDFGRNSQGYDDLWDETDE